MNLEEIVMYIIARADLKMSHGKFGAQVGHGVQYALERVKAQEHHSFKEWHAEWAAKSSTKIVLQVNSRDELLKIRLGLAVRSESSISEALALGGIPAALVIDEGRTEIAASTETVVALVPLPRRLAKPYVGHLKPYR